MAKFLDDRKTLAGKINIISDVFLLQMVVDKTYSGFECMITREKLFDLQQQYKFLYQEYYNGKN